MSSRRRLWKTAGLPASSLALIVCLSSLAGCNPHKDQLRPENLFGRIGRPSGQIIEPKRCMLRVAILNRPFRDAVINEAVWRAADEQAIAPEARRALEVNGVRIGQITGELPPELVALLEAPPPNKVEPASFLLDDGDQTLISMCDPVDQVSLLLNRENRPYGKDFQAASGYFRVTATHDGGDGLALRFTPEIHHGPVQRSYQPLTHATPYTPQQFRINDGQQEEALGDLAANLVLEPGQVAVIGCRPEQERSLGAFLFTPTEHHGDQKRQKLVIVWASRNQVGVVGEKHAKTDRPVPTRDSRTPPAVAIKPTEVSSRAAKAGDKGPPGSAAPRDAR
jgi:hypothetical protein